VTLFSLDSLETGGFDCHSYLRDTRLAGGAPNDLGAILAERVQTIAREVQRLPAIWFEQEAVV
jgi:hypothetical protein